QGYRVGVNFSIGTQIEYSFVYTFGNYLFAVTAQNFHNAQMDLSISPWPGSNGHERGAQLPTFRKSHSCFYPIALGFYRRCYDTGIGAFMSAYTYRYPSEGRIVLLLTARKKAVHVYIHDQGIGIFPESFPYHLVCHY